ncbi:unnamed protein product [Mytilus coruscus]|uniref:Uncharacterized protein n=1 Tax=Mytilus coruscus TaxID=42192 RepID=A0A6J8AZ08_MYTCO|nr:unnamed protein product [Mytilus coruscus]
MDTLTLFNAAVVLPFTAGEPSKTHHSIDNIRPNDGSISGLILLSWFLQVCIRSFFKCSWKIYYSLLLIVLANISQWAHYFAEIYKDTNSESNGMHCQMRNKCHPKKFLDSIKPFATPAEMEYFLLSMIFIAELWQSNDNEPPSSRLALHLANVNTPLLTSLLPVTDSEEVSQEASRESKAKYDSCPVMLIVFGVVIVLPSYILAYYRNESENTENADIAYDTFLSSLAIILLIFSFHMFTYRSYLRAVMGKQHLHFHHKIIIVSFVGSIGYQSLIVFSCIQDGFDRFGDILDSFEYLSIYLDLECFLSSVT